MPSGAALALEAAASGLDMTKLAVYEPPFSMDDEAFAKYAGQLTALLAEGRWGDAVWP
jgi:hypothetical protein